MLHVTDKDENNLLKAAQAVDGLSLVHHSVFPGEKKPHPLIKSGASAPQDGMV